MIVLAVLMLTQTPVDASKVDRSKPQEAATLPESVVTPDGQQAQATVGALFSDGNVSSIAGRLGGFWQLRAGVHGLRAELGAGIASIAQDPDLDPSDGFDVPLGDAENRLNTTAAARLRYDFFLGADDSLYAAGFAFHDSAANLVARLRADVGYRHFFFQVPKHSFAGEVGAVYTIDSAPVGDTNKDGITDASDLSVFEKSGGTYGARLAVAYTNALLDNVQYSTTAEVVPNIFPDVDAPFEQARSPSAAEGEEGEGDNKLGFGEATIFTWTHTLTFKVTEALNVGVAVGILYDNGAIVRRNAYTNHDVSATFQLGYQLF